MKSRTELIEMANQDNFSSTEAVTLFVLLDIRDLLVEANKVIEVEAPEPVCGKCGSNRHTSH